jgi:hypothetical protein
MRRALAPVAVTSNCHRCQQPERATVPFEPGTVTNDPLVSAAVEVLMGTETGTRIDRVAIEPQPLLKCGSGMGSTTRVEHEALARTERTYVHQ